MRIPIAVRWLALIALGVGTFVTTRTILARVQPRRTPQDQASPSGRPDAPGLVVRAGAVETPAGPERSRPPGAHSIYSGAMRRFRGEAIGNVVHMAAEARIRDTRPDVPYVWTVRVFLPEDTEFEQPLFEHRFLDRTLTIPAGQTIEPTFDEAMEITLPGGTYVVELGALAEPGTGPNAIGPKGRMRITLGQ